MVGIFQEYLFPGTKDVFFYRHASTGACYFDKPAKLKMLDEQAFREQRQIFLYGYIISDDFRALFKVYLLHLLKGNSAADRANNEAAGFGAGASG